jgi:hypothetical protein
MPRSIVHLLLSLLLLVSQQLALAHGLSHLDLLRQQGSAQQVEGIADGARGPQRQDVQGDPDTPALHEFCAECAADSQLDVALPLPDHAFLAPQTVAAPRAARCSEGVRPQVIRPFQPRGPPRAI